MHSNPDVQAAIGKMVALVLWAHLDDGADDVAVFSRRLLLSDDGYILAGESGQEIAVESEWLTRVKAVPVELQSTVLGCKFQVSLKVGKIGAPEHKQKMAKLGLQWPS